mgnify:CR=1 FL=1
MRELALIWMSAGNSYFNEKNIGQLLQFADKNFQRIIVLSPDEPAEHTFRSLGYSENKTKRKAKLNSNLLINRAKRELQKIKGKYKFSFVDWGKEVVNNPEYKKTYQEVISLYENNKNFREDARETTKKVINGKFHENIEVEKAIEEAVLYLIEELSFVLSCHLIYKVDNIIYLYHQNWEIYQNLIAGKYDQQKRENMFFVLTGVK